MHILIFTHFFPPLNAIASQRPLSFAKHFSSAGHKVTVITTQKYSVDGKLDLTAELNENIDVIEIPYTRLFFWKSKYKSFEIKGKSNITAKSKIEFMKQMIKGVLNSMGFLIDHQLFWAGKATKKARSIHRSSPIDLVLSTFSPSASHIAASKLVKVEKDIKWIADYRDLWSLNHIDRAKGFLNLLEKKIEKQTIKRANAVTTVSKPLADQLTQLVQKNTLIEVVYNGFDDSLTQIKNPKTEKEINSPFKIVYTGTIYKGRRDPSPLFSALNELESEGFLKPDSIQIEFYGLEFSNLNAIIEMHSAQKWVKVNGYLPYQASLKVQSDADALLFLESNEKEAKGVLTGKLFEYLITGRPILGIGITNDSAAGQLINETSTGFVLEDNIQKIKAVIKDIINKKTTLVRNEEKISEYSRTNQAKKLLSIMSTIIAK